MDQTIKTLFDWYLSHQSELLKKYKGRVLVITSDGVVGEYDSNQAAYLAASEHHKPGTFIIQRCSSGTDDTVSKFYSRVSF